MVVQDEQLDAVLSTLTPTQMKALTKAMVEGALDHAHSVMISIPEDALKSPLDTWVIRKEIERSWDALSDLSMWKWLMDNAIIDREHPGLPPVVQRQMTQNPELRPTYGPNSQDKFYYPTVQETPESVKNPNEQSRVTRLLGVIKQVLKLESVDVRVCAEYGHEILVQGCSFKLPNTWYTSQTIEIRLSNPLTELELASPETVPEDRPTKHCYLTLMINDDYLQTYLYGSWELALLEWMAKHDNPKLKTLGESMIIWRDLSLKERSQIVSKKGFEVKAEFIEHAISVRGPCPKNEEQIHTFIDECDIPRKVPVFSKPTFERDYRNT